MNCTSDLIESSYLQSGKILHFVSGRTCLVGRSLGNKLGITFLSDSFVLPDEVFQEGFYFHPRD